MCEDKVSIIMGVYNSSKTLIQAIDSIINQTYKNWELVVCDDCSTDDSYDILLEYKKKYPDKIILLRNKKNSKLSYALNQCLKHATGRYIARMDADDISVQDRLEKQVKFLIENPTVNLVGTAMRRFNEDGLADVVLAIEKPNKYSLRYGVPFWHATIMTYKYVYDELNGYTVSERTKRSQDRDLWFRFFYKDFTGANLNEPLYLVREDIEAIKRRSFKVRLNSYKTTLMGYRLLGYPLLWYVRPTLSLLKGLVPSKVVFLYRKYQKNRLNRIN